MTQQIDPVKLKAAAEHLEWVCQQYPDNEDVQGLYRGLLPMIEDAKAGRVTEPVNRQKISGRYLMTEGVYREYLEPDVEGAYYKFRTEMEGGLSETGKRIIAKIEAMNKAAAEGGKL